MQTTLFSYRFAQEILANPTYNATNVEIMGVVQGCPLYTWPNKSVNNVRLDVVQQLMNCYFDRRFSCDLGWDFHPNATGIENSELKADFRKNFQGLRIQAEVQFGNMARWYSDIFKFQAAYSQNMIDLGLCIVPMADLAKRIDSNIVNYERCIRELPAAKLSITLPILIIGINPDDGTQKFDVSNTQFANLNAITGRANAQNKFRVVNGLMEGTVVTAIGPGSEVGLMPANGLVDLGED